MSARRLSSAGWNHFLSSPCLDMLPAARFCPSPDADADADADAVTAPLRPGPGSLDPDCLRAVAARRGPGGTLGLAVSKREVSVGRAVFRLRLGGPSRVGMMRSHVLDGRQGYVAGEGQGRDSSRGVDQGLSMLAWDQVASALPPPTRRPLTPPRPCRSITR
jgi:hypothetical protein